MSEKNKGMLEMLACAILWSIAGLFIKLINWNPFVLAGFRSLFSALTVLVYVIIKKKKIVVKAKTVLIGFAFAALFFCFIGANKLTTASNAIVLQFTSPIFVMLLSVIFFKKKFKGKDILAALFTLLGITLCFVQEMEGGHLIGNIVAIGAGFFMAIMFVSLGEMDSDEKFSSQLIGHLITAIVGISFIPFTENEFVVSSWIYIAILGIVQLGIPYILLALSSEKCPPLACCLISAAEPLLNPVWVAIFTKEIPGPLAIVGGIVVIVTVTVWSIFNKD